MESDYEELAQGLFALADQVRDAGELTLEDFQEVYEADGGAALALASSILINHEVKLPPHLYELYKKFGQPGDYLDEYFADLEEIYLRK